MRPDKRCAFLAAAALAAALCLVGCSSGSLRTSPGHPSQGWYYKVCCGDRLTAIAERCGRPVELIAKVNNLGNPALLYEGLYLWIPPLDQPSGVAPSVLSSRASAAPADFGVKSSSQELARSREAKKPDQSSYSKIAFWKSGDSKKSDSPTRPLDPQLLGSKPRSSDGSQVLSHSQTRISRAPDAEQLGFGWPLNPKECTVVKTNRGLDLLTVQGAPVRASRAGVVLASGAPLRGYGNMVLIDHKDGYITVYAHNSQNLVQKDQGVQKGQIVARVGSTGNAEAPKLHFEIRKKTEPVEDARSYLIE